MLEKYYLYRHIRNDINKPFYVGIGTKPKVFNGNKTEYKRAFDFSPKKRSNFWFAVFSKVNKDISVEILFESNSYDEIKRKEQEFISIHGRNDCDNGTLVNLTDGGEGVIGKIVSEETKKLLSKLLKGKRHTQETIDKIILNHASKQEGYVKTVSFEQRKQISQSLTGRYLKEDILCIETGIVYGSVRELCNEMFGGKGNIKVLQALSDKYPHKSYKGFHFTKDINDTTIKVPSYFKKIVCIDTMQEFQTITECAISLFGSKTHKYGLSKAIISNKKYRNLTFKAA